MPYREQAERDEYVPPKPPWRAPMWLAPLLLTIGCALLFGVCGDLKEMFPRWGTLLGTGMFCGSMGGIVSATWLLGVALGIVIK